MVNYSGRTLDNGRYEIKELTGVGGMAYVYRAYDNIDDRVVAIKILKEEFIANEDFRRRFKNESKAIAVLSHPNIVKVYDVNYGEKLQYIVMEYIEGITLKEYIEQVKTVNWKEAVLFTTQILKALQHAHDKGIVHRDIKPQNIMLSNTVGIKVADFGIALFSRDEAHTIGKNAIGSVHYISPEQAKGEIIDEKADLYSVGVVLYEMLTGQVPFHSENPVSVAIMQTQDEPKPPRMINNTIPVGLEQIVLKAMRKDTSTRYQSASEMLLDIENFQKNPDIRFEHSYSIDDTPTRDYKKVVTGTSQESGSGSPQIKSKSKASSIIIGAVAGLAVLTVLIFIITALSSKKFNSEKVVVPDFIGKDYSGEIKGNPAYKDFIIVAKEIQNNQFDAGKVYLQEPPKGTKIRKDQQITLTVAVGSKMITIPNIYNLQFAQAKITLENLGFAVSEIAEPNTSVAFGTVLRSSPEQGKQAPSGSTVIVYYASDENLVEIPDLVTPGWDVENAKRLLESVGLTLDEKITQEDSIVPAGKIIRQYPDPGLKVTKGNKVTVTISSGIAPESSVKITVKLPNKPSPTKGKLMATLNSDIRLEKDVLLDGGKYSFDITGKGSGKNLKVFVDSQLIYSCTIDFTVVPGKISDEKQYSTLSNVILPNVISMQKDEAIETLHSKGFLNVEVIKIPVDDPDKDGIVISQEPEHKSIFPYKTDTLIKITVGELET
ncbi:MAG: Stk1 family PASTA domain-containing Ser/Thr kinase [Acutalibacteraceae bacterium]|jgi:serine/threonine-protein kinase